MVTVEMKYIIIFSVCTKKSAIGSVTIKMPGTGKFDINGQELDYFPRIRARESVIYPLQIVDWLGTVDIQATVTSRNRGEMAQAAALRWGIATGIAALGKFLRPLTIVLLHISNYSITF